MENENCKGCRGSVRVPDSQIKEMLEEIINGGNFNSVSDEVYEKRLILCGNCKYLEYGNTCLQCGCIVHIRARLQSGTCPNPGAAKW